MKNTTVKEKKNTHLEVPSTDSVICKVHGAHTGHAIQQRGAEVNCILRREKHTNTPERTLAEERSPAVRYSSAIEERRRMFA